MKKYRNYIIVALVLIAFLVTICFIPISVSKLIPMVEKQISEDTGVKIHIEKLILRVGPSVKIKAPVMHLMYEDGKKFGQFNNVRFYIPWSSLVKNEINLHKIRADKLIVKISSNDKCLDKILNKFKEKDFNETPNIVLDSYNISFYDGNIDKKLCISGRNLNISKLNMYKNYKFSADGNFYINDKKYLSYNVSIPPNLPASAVKFPDYNNIVNQIESLDFHSDIISDLKISQSSNDNIQISGLINIDNITVLDKDKKNPKSFIYLTFWGEKTGINSNIYATADKKINIEGIVSNSKKKELDLRVKSDEIKLSDLYKKIKLLADCSKFKDIESIDGLLAADFNIKGDINKIKSSGYLNIQDASIKANGLDCEKIKSKVDFNGNTITINNAIGYVHGAPIMLRGKIDKKLDIELLMSKVELKHLLPEEYGIKNGIMSLTANLSGTLDNIIHKENIQVSNFLSSKNNSTLSFDNLKIDTNKENIAYISNIILKPEKTEFFKIPLLKLNVSDDVIKMYDTNIYMPNSKIKANGSITSYYSSEAAFDLKFDGVINSKDLGDKSQCAGNYPIKININGNKLWQNVESQFLIENATVLDEPGIVNFICKVEDKNLKIEDLSISSSDGKFSNNLKSNLKSSKKISISGIIENFDKPSFKNIRIFIPQQLNLSFNDTAAQIKGDVFLNGDIKKPEIVGQVSVQNLINQFLKLSVNNTTLDFNKNVVILNIPLLKLNDSSMSINSTMLTDISKEIVFKNMNIKSRFLNTDTIISYKKYLPFDKFPVKVLDGKIFTEKAEIVLYEQPIVLTALSSDLRINDYIMNLPNLSAELVNGKLAAVIDYNLINDNFNSKIQARGVSAAPIFDVIAIKKDSVSGTMDFDTSLKGNIYKKESLNGDVKFEVHNGRMGTLGKLEHLLYAQNVIADNMLRTSLSVITKAITLKDTGLFKYLRGDITLTNGIANIKFLQSQGPLMSLFIKGQYNTENDYAKLVVLGRLSDEIISGLGAFGEFSMNKLMVMLTGEENKYNIKSDDIEKLPPLPVRNTKEFRTIINGILEKPSSVVLFNWISYTQKSYRQREVPMGDAKVPDFIDSLPY